MINPVHFPIADLPLHPHIKLTDEEFPRLLATRKVEDDGCEYFGPFLPRTGARILIDFLNVTFKLRSCTIPIDGTFEVPCTQYYARRCVAPCVVSLCGPDEYLDVVGLARSFLKNERKEFELTALAIIDAAAERLDYERAAFFRDILTSVQAFWAHPRRQVWIDDAVDTYVVDREADIVRIFIITTRRARTLGSWTCSFQIFDETDIREVLANVIRQFYPVGGPREIRVPFDFEGRHQLSRNLTQLFGRPVKIIVEGQVPERVTALKALARTKLSLDLEELMPRVTAEKIQRQLVMKFGLPVPPERIEAYDAAHISGTFSTAGMAVWQRGRLVSEEYRVGISELSSELATLKEFLLERLSDQTLPVPGLILIDGGKAQLNAAQSVLGKASVEIPVIGAVKPPRKHGEISHFLTASGERIEFDLSNPAMRVLKQLRDEAHELANTAHRKSRDMAHFYELAGILPSLNEKERRTLTARFGTIRKIVDADETAIADVVGRGRAMDIRTDLDEFRQGRSRDRRPLIVPIRYDDPNGHAADLMPISTINQ